MPKRPDNRPWAQNLLSLLFPARDMGLPGRQGVRRWRGNGKAVTYRPLIDILKDLERAFVKGTVCGEHFSERFYPNCKDEKIVEFLKSL